MAESNSNPEELQEDDAGQVESTPVAESEEQLEGTGQEQSDAGTENSEGSEKESQDEASKTEEQSQDGEEDTFFDPNQVPEELKPVYKNMQAAFTRKTQELAQKRQESTGETPAQQFQAEKQQETTDSPGDDVRAEVLKELNIDESKLDDRTRQVLNLMITAAEKVAGRTVGKAVQPLYEKSTEQELQGFFEKTPEAKGYAKQMAAIDRRTNQRLSLDELYVLASRQDRDTRAKDQRSSNAQQRRQQNSESAAGSSAQGTAPSSNPIDGLYEAAQKRDEWMP